jgi:hypothetical protein
MESEGRQETNYAFRNFVRRIDQREMLSDRRRLRSVQAAAYLFEEAFLNESGQIIPRDAEGEGVFRANNLSLGSQTEEAF